VFSNVATVAAVSVVRWSVVVVRRRTSSNMITL